MNGNTHRKQYPVLAAFAVAAALCLALAPVAAAQDVAQVRAGSSTIDFHPVVAHGGLVLTVSGPNGFHHRAELGSGESPSFSIFDESGGVLPDGSYKYELRVTPTNTQRREALEANRLETRAARQGIVPLVQSGSFAVIEGVVVAEGATEPGAEGGSTPAPSGGNVLSTKDFVINDDLIVTGSACIGFDCVNGESFGFDTIRLKENNLRIKFEDTSTIAGFPSADWQLTANDSASGGLDRFSIEQTSAGLVPFTVEGGALSNSLYVDTGLRVGIGTSAPILNLHVSTGNTPSLRLEQNTSSGFQAQTFDVAGNEANFFVRDVTNGSRLPFRIRPGAPTSSLDIAASGNVGIGTTSPSEALHVRRTNGSALALIEEASGTTAGRELMRLTNNGSAQVVLENSNSGVDWQFGPRDVNDDFAITRLGSGSTEMVLSTTGNLTITGSLTVGPGGCSGCDLVFSPDYEVESIEAHAEYMWKHSHLPGVGPTPEDQPMNLSKKTGGILNELEKAHIYIEQLHERLARLEAELAER